MGLLLGKLASLSDDRLLRKPLHDFIVFMRFIFSVPHFMAACFLLAPALIESFVRLRQRAAVVADGREISVPAVVASQIDIPPKIWAGRSARSWRRREHFAAEIVPVGARSACASGK